MGPTDAHWLDHLFVAHARAIRAYAWRRVQPDLVDDIVAEVFGAAWRDRRRVPDDRPLPWLYRTAANIIFNHHRTTTRRTAREHRASDVPVILDQTDAVADAILVARALADLEHADAEVLRLAYWEDLLPADIAVVLGCSPGAARTRLHRARSRLRDILADADDPDPDAVASNPEHPRRNPAVHDPDGSTLTDAAISRPPQVRLAREEQP